jgi:aminopeptidase 2
LSEESGKNVEKVMDIWTKNVGFPIITVTEDAKANEIKLQQNRFLRTSDVKSEEDKTLYPVAIGLRTKKGIDEDTLLNERNMSIKLDDLGFYKINADHSGLFRTLYPQERLFKLGKAAGEGLLSVQDRAGMIADAGALAASGHQSTSGLLSLLQGFNRESEYVVWQEITTRLGSVRGAWMFEDQSIKDALQTFQKDLVSSRAHEIGWEFQPSDGHVQQQYKSLLFGSAALSGDKKTLEAAYDMFEQFKAGDRKAIHPNIRSSVYQAVLKRGATDDVSSFISFPKRRTFNTSC